MSVEAKKLFSNLFIIFRYLCFYTYILLYMAFILIRGILYWMINRVRV